MVWVYKLKNLTWLNWAGLCLLALNIGGLSILLLSEPASESNEFDYPSLDLFFSENASALNEQHSVDHLAVLDVASEEKISEGVSDKFNRSANTPLHQHTEDVEPTLSSQVEVLKERVSKTPEAQFRQSELVTRMCYEIGPLTLNGDKTSLQSLLEVKGMFTTVKYYQTNENLGYWVFISPLRSRALARLKVEELKLKEFKHAILLSRVEPINAVSLGVFEDEKEAHELLLKAQSLGFSVKMDIRSQGVANAWLMVEVDQQRNLDDAGWGALLQDYTDLKRRSVDCPS